MSKRKWHNAVLKSIGEPAPVLPGALVKRKKEPAAGNDADGSAADDDTTTADEDDDVRADGGDRKSSCDGAYDSSADDGLVVIERKMSPSDRLKLPGARVRIDTPPEGTLLGQIHQVPASVVRYVRAYMDVLFGSVLLESRRLAIADNFQSIDAVPRVVMEILAYNNVEFSRVTFHVTAEHLFEPIAYTMDLSSGTLALYANRAMYNEYCLYAAESPVIFMNGICPINQHNPAEVDPSIGSINYAVIRCAIACDHVAQHILHDVLTPPDVRPGQESRGLHDDWTTVGTTLHSMFRIERTYSDFDRRNDAATTTQYHYVSHGLGLPMQRTTDGNMFAPPPSVFDQLALFTAARPQLPPQ